MSQTKNAREYDRVINVLLEELGSFAGSLESDIVLTDEELEVAQMAMWSSRWK